MVTGLNLDGADSRVSCGRLWLEKQRLSFFRHFFCDSAGEPHHLGSRWALLCFLSIVCGILKKKTWVLLAFHIVMLNMTVCRATPIEPIHRRLGEKIRIRAIEGPREREREGTPACCSALVGAQWKPLSGLVPCLFLALRTLTEPKQYSWSYQLNVPRKFTEMPPLEFPEPCPSPSRFNLQYVAIN
jgi:hypothetical protein